MKLIYSGYQTYNQPPPSFPQQSQPPANFSDNQYNANKDGGSQYNRPPGGGGGGYSSRGGSSYDSGKIYLITLEINKLFTSVALHFHL